MIDRILDWKRIRAMKFVEGLEDKLVKEIAAVLLNHDFREPYCIHELGEKMKSAGFEIRNNEHWNDIFQAIRQMHYDIASQPFLLQGYSDFSGIEFEPKSPRENNKKLLFTYDKSLERIRAAGHERHALPSEAFGFLIANLENRLTAEQKAIASDMLSSYGEWLSMAWQRKGDKVICYSNPENLKWDGSKYAVDGRKLICSSENEFPLARDIPSEEWVDLGTFDAGLVQFLYSRPFGQLPKGMHEGDKRTQLYLPPENILWPLGRGGFNSNYIVNSYYCNDWASRWVAVRKKIS